MKTRLLLLVALLSACGSNPESRVYLAAASSTTEVSHAFVAEYNAENPSIPIALQNDASSRLRTQIQHGARADVFLSAHPDQIDLLEQRVIERSVWGRDQLVVALAKDNPRGLQTVADLHRPGVRIVRAEDAVPAGKYALQWLEKIDPEVRRAIEKNVISLESNVRQVRAKLLLGEVDAAFMYRSNLEELPWLENGPVVHTTLELALLNTRPESQSVYRALLKIPKLLRQHGFEALK